jgi:hypothetical protein
MKPQRDQYIINDSGGITKPEPTGQTNYLHNPDSTPMSPVITFNGDDSNDITINPVEPKKRKIRPRVLKEDYDRTVSFLSKAAIVMTIAAAIGWAGFIYVLAKLL